MILQLDFDEPLALSPAGQKDVLVVEIVDPSFFESKNGGIVPQPGVGE